MLAAAPTTPPCFCRRQRSSLLYSGHVQWNLIFIFRICRSPDACQGESLPSANADRSPA
ncbi:hypothetical protein HMPREF9436_02777 [Faecalibacterium cf. prausnitzii KLE1255]|uniref:Uncharacterized protein n=1 Tax=Faecalibacterium cf. prausnitzii KLE1255 TaxID=748224 RepID=E2ZM66_9FIRM|nr:hypothetical protein HMPREF9436_02777 [Faecalibacterium cf. prausnitzii KLE1255]